ncbi:rho guanine nucleotide exchange factor 10-like isoform X2 [Argonauta hians]
MASTVDNPSLTEWDDMDIYYSLPTVYAASNSICEEIHSNSGGNLDPSSSDKNFMDKGTHDLHIPEELLPNNPETEGIKTEDSMYAVPIPCNEEPFLTHSLKRSASESVCPDITKVESINLDYNFYGNDFHDSSKQSSLVPLLDNDSENLYETLNFRDKGSVYPHNPTVNIRRKIFRRKKQNKKWNFFRRSDPINFIFSLSEDGENKKVNAKSQTRQKHATAPPSQAIGSSDLSCEEVSNCVTQQLSLESDVSWPSDEFDSSDNLNSDSDNDYPNKPLPPIPKKQSSRFPDSEAALLLLNKIRHSTGTKNFSDNEEESLCLPVTLKADHFIPPNLPPSPEGLTCKQIKRRCVLECIISSEKSYIESLLRIHRDYETTILEAVDLQKSKVKSSLKKLREILNYHRMFQIELANRVNDWKEENMIGDVFIASFSKSMVLDAYSVYVNNFTATMEDIKRLQRTRQSFREFLKQKETSSPDRLSIFALMVKPIQRFPQFIMCLQDLLKYTPKGHKDRKALQLAVTILENLALKLNDRKRESEKKFAAKQLAMKIRISSFQNSFVIREDDVFHVFNTGTKKRRLIMLNNALVCIKVQYSDRDGEICERYKHKWTVPLQEVRLKFGCSMSPKRNPPVTPNEESYGINRFDSTEKNVEDIFEEIREMNHDYHIWSQIHNLASSLKLTYDILNVELINGILGDLQRKIQAQNEEVQLVNNCTIELQIPDRSGKVCEVFQTMSPILKQQWCLDLAIAQLALSPLNQPAWDIPVLHNTDQLTESLSAYYVSYLPIDVSTNRSQLQCAVGVYLQSFTSFHIGIPHIWVCSNIADSCGQVSIVSVQTGCSSVYLNESFQATDSAITCVESVPGDSNPENYHMDTVWMATAAYKMYIYGLQMCKSKQREPMKVFDVPAKVLHLLYAGDKVFAGTHNGCLLIFERESVGSYQWCVETPQVLKLSSSAIICLQEVTSDNCILAAADNTLHKIDYSTGELLDSSQLSPTDIIQNIVQAGVGIWVSYQNSATIHLYHIENMNLLQDINISSAASRVLPTESLKDCTVTCILASLGMLWIGTNVGLLLSFPLPRLRNGVPIVSGRPYVSYHGHKESVRFLLPFMLGFRTRAGCGFPSSQNKSKTLTMPYKSRTLKTPDSGFYQKNITNDTSDVNNTNDNDVRFRVGDDDVSDDYKDNNANEDDNHNEDDDDGDDDDDDDGGGDDDDDDDHTLVADKYKVLETELKAKLIKRYNSTPDLLNEDEGIQNVLPNVVSEKHNRGPNEMEVLYGSLMCSRDSYKARTQSLYHHRLSRSQSRGHKSSRNGDRHSSICGNKLGANKRNFFTRHATLSSAPSRHKRCSDDPSLTTTSWLSRQRVTNGDDGGGDGVGEVECSGPIMSKSLPLNNYPSDIRTPTPASGPAPTPTSASTPASTPAPTLISMCTSITNSESAPSTPTVTFAVTEENATTITASAAIISTTAAKDTTAAALATQATDATTTAAEHTGTTTTSTTTAEHTATTTAAEEKNLRNILVKQKTPVETWNIMSLGVNNTNEDSTLTNVETTSSTITTTNNNNNKAAITNNNNSTNDTNNNKDSTTTINTTVTTKTTSEAPSTSISKSSSSSPSSTSSSSSSSTSSSSSSSSSSIVTAIATASQKQLSQSSSSTTAATTTATTTAASTTTVTSTTSKDRTKPLAASLSHSSSLQSQMSQSSRIWEYQEESDCNSIMIVSGGNGYLSASPNTAAGKTSRGNDSTLLFWIYKI